MTLKEPLPVAPGTADARSGQPHRATAWPEARAAAARAGASARAGRAPLGVPLGQALGQVLAEPLLALTDLPPFDTSAMDGWAVAGPGPWTVRAEGAVLAGQASEAEAADGEAVRIATGARVPAGTTAVVRAEHARTEHARTEHARTEHAPADHARAGRAVLHALREVVPGQDIRPRGQECRTGDELLPAGTVVTPAVLGLAAAAGYDELPVPPRPRVEILVLGDELLTTGLPHEGLIRDALGPMLGPWLAALGADVLATRRIGDEAEELYAAVTGSAADLVLTTGGTAAGPVDHVHGVLDKAGATLLVDGVKVRPGHPMLLARLAAEPTRAEPLPPESTRAEPTRSESTRAESLSAEPASSAPGRAELPHVRHLVGLPGNPLAAVSGLLTLAQPLLAALTGAAAAAPAPPRVPVQDEVPGHPYDTRLVPVVRRGGRALPLRYNGPAMLRGIAAADGLAVVPPGGARPGQELDVLDLPWPAAEGAVPAQGACFT
ncbi:molybdopterin molybdotransferase [Streptomyces sp. PvR006]|uniref:molybdopterin molybdotransferase MoeA n=1 Tax=Streptomyces sp. PvR006 TaxID=2817860 RepID=UPI001AE4F0E6|nr:molybdopterin molybdotransferase MoeA [Streptomyces sp. PvR006]MBP2583300.1 molybdopterin molybdotransferase [Streptomyces sp. PvR006]